MFSTVIAVPEVAMSAEQFQRVAKALADPRRFGIFERIAAAGPELACQRLCDCFPVSQATVSHHLKELTGAGLVESRREGQYVYYRARPDVLRAYLAELQRRVPLGAPEAIGD
jgi:ArsR family transcriptional regulator